MDIKDRSIDVNPLIDPDIKQNNQQTAVNGKVKLGKPVGEKKDLTAASTTTVNIHDMSHRTIVLFP